MPVEEPEFTEEQLQRCEAFGHRFAREIDELEALTKGINNMVLASRKLLQPDQKIVDMVEEVRPGYMEESSDNFNRIAAQSQDSYDDLQRLHEEGRGTARTYIRMSAPGLPREERLALWRELGEPDLDALSGVGG